MECESFFTKFQIDSNLCCYYVINVVNIDNIYMSFNIIDYKIRS